MWDKFQAWLEHNQLNHAGIVLLGMWPFIQFHELIGSNAWGAAVTWIFGYFMREVMTFGGRGFWKSMAFWNWPRHDLIQTIYATITAVAWASLYTYRLSLVLIAEGLI